MRYRGSGCEEKPRNLGVAEADLRPLSRGGDPGDPVARVTVAYRASLDALSEGRAPDVVANGFHWRLVVPRGPPPWRVAIMTVADNLRT